jgi:hypothetical protein
VVLTYAVLLLIDYAWTRFVVFDKDWYGASIVRRAFENDDPREIPVYGSSLAQRSYMPEILGERFYNYGRRGSNFQKIYPLLENEFQKKRSGPVIIDFYFNFLNYQEEYTLNMRDFIPVAREPLAEEILRDFDMYSPAFKIPGFRYCGFFADYWIRRQNDWQEEELNYLDKGGAFYKPLTPNEEFEEYVRSRSSTYVPFTVSPQLEERFLAILKSRPDRKVIMVISPNHASSYGTITHLEDMEAYLQQLGQQFPNVSWLVFDGREYPDDHFKDSFHMNIRGARRFSTELKERLSQLPLE